MIRSRFAPSPTGFVHIGSLRTALYEYLTAKSEDGKYILRIEDTDQERYVEGALENLLKVFEWLEIEHDEGPMLDGTEIGEYGPYIQSKRKELHKEHAQKLLKSGHAYYCFCSKERIDELREKQKKNKQAPMYDRKCCDLPDSEIKKNLDEGVPYVIRHKIPYELIKFKDLIRGNVQFHGKTIDDTILIKSDGYPTYHLANVVDDHHMKITHVVRGEEWLPSTPKHIALYEALGWDIPEFAHMPLILNPDRTKLSKRQGHVAVEDYIKEGYCKEAIINFIALLGWNPGDGDKQEIFSLEELKEKFKIEKVHKSGAIFDIEKLNWFNWQWNKRLFNEELEETAKSIDPKVEITKDNRGQQIYNFSNENNENEFLNMRGEKLLTLTNEYLSQESLENKDLLLKALITVEEKIHKDPKETQENINFYYELPDYSTELLTHEKMKVDLDTAKTALTQVAKDLESLEIWTIKGIQDKLISTVETLALKNGQVFWPARAALSGQDFSPGVFETAWTLGKEESLSRINRALSKL